MNKENRHYYYRLVLYGFLIGVLIFCLVKDYAKVVSAKPKPLTIQASIWQYPVSPYVPGSYANRYFYCCSSNRHLGEDVEAHEGTAIRPIGPGVIKFYSPATSYGELVVAIEHDLGAVYSFKNAYNNTVATRYVLSIYGHLRKSQVRGGQATGLSVGAQVDANTVIGYVNDSSHPDGGTPDHNGDGLEHVHVGIRLSNAATAQKNDGRYWLRGYEGGGKNYSGMGKDFAPASAVISALINAQPFDGSHDANNCDKIYGWAWDRTQPGRRVNVEIYDGNALIGTALANQLRTDLRDLGLGDGSGTYGFNFPTPASMKNGATHTIRVKVAGTDFYLGNTAKTFNSVCSSTPKAVISLSGGGKSGGNNQTLAYNVPVGQKIKMTFDAVASQVATTGIRIYNWTRRKLFSSSSKSQITSKAEITTTNNLPRFDDDLDAGTYSVNLEVVDEAGLRDTATATIVVEETAEPKPRAILSMSSGGQTGTNGQTLNYTVASGGSINMSFDASGSQAGSGNITAYEWRSNGTVISNSANFTLPFAAALHTITLKVTNSAGLSDTATATIIVAESTANAPTSIISMNSGGQTGSNGQTLSYTVTPGGSINMSFDASGSQAGTGTITSYEWRSNGTFISNLPNFSFPFGTASHTITLKVTNSVGLSNTATATIIVNAVATPVINSIAPTAPAATVGNQNVQVNGGNFQQGLTVTVTFPNGQTGSLSGTQIQNVTPTSFRMIVDFNGNPGNYSIRVNNPNGVQSNAFGFNVQRLSQNPVINSVSPATPTRRDSDQSATVNGSGFQSGLTVTVFYPGGSSTLSGTQIQNVTSSSFTMVITLNLTGQYGIRVNNPDGGQSNTFSFNVQNPISTPQINSISPNAPTRRDTDQSVTVNGSGFQSGLTVTVFYPGGSSTLSGTQIQNVSSGSFNMIVTLNLTGQYGIRVNNPDGGQSNTFNFNVQNPISTPQISSISPTSPTRRDTDQNVVVTGSSFQSGLTVTVFYPGGNSTLSGTQIQNVTTNSFTMIVTLNIAGQYGIRVNNPDGGQSNTLNFNVQNPISTPQINSISPSSPLRNNNNQNVSVFGSGFQSGLTVTVFYPGGSSTLSGTQIQNVTNSSFTMIVTLNLTGQYSIRVNNPDGGQSNTFGFSVQNPISSPQISSISPASPTTSNGDQNVTVFGSSFQSGLTVTVFYPGGSSTLSGTQIQNVTSGSFTMIVTMNIVGQYGIRVNNPDGGQSNTFNFSTQAANPSISSISPSSPTRSNSDQTVTVFGSSFQSGLTVTVFFPTGGNTTLSGTQIQNVSSGSFNMIITLNLLGTYSIRVNNPNGRQSNTFAFNTR